MPACSPHQECVGGACAPRYSAVEWVAPTPAEGARVAMGGLQLGALLRLSPGRTANDPAELSYSAQRQGGAVQTGRLSRADAGYYVGGFAPSLGDGRYELVVRYEEASLSSMPRALVVDGTGPTFRVLVQGAPPRVNSGGLSEVDPQSGFGQAYRRDEVAVVKVSSADTDVNGSTVTLSVRGLGDGGVGGAWEAPLQVQVESGCGQAWCGSAQVELWRPEMKAFRGDFELLVRGRDEVGNEGVADGGIRVTRWKWARDFGAFNLKATPAIGRDGTVYVGLVGGGNTGALHAVSPSGAVKWSFDAGAVEASPAVGVPQDGGVDTVFVAATTSTGGVLYALNSQSGVQLEACPMPATSSSRASLAVATFAVGAEVLVGAVGVQNLTNTNRLVSIRPGAAAVPDRCIFGVPLTSDGSAAFPATVSMKGTSAFYGDESGNVLGYEFNGSWMSKPGWPVPANLFTRGLAVVGMDVVGGGGPGQGGGVFRIPFSGGAQPAWKYPMGPSSPAWSPAVGGGNEIYFANQTPLLTRVVLNGASALSTAATTGTVKGAPLIGADGAVYTASESGTLTAWTRSLEALWTVNSLGAVESSPALDCKRDGAGNKLAGPGVLYVASNNGRLHGFIVDSRGIDTQAPWPKYQHDPRNTGNADTPLSEFACP